MESSDGSKHHFENKVAVPFGLQLLSVKNDEF